MGRLRMVKACNGPRHPGWASGDLSVSAGHVAIQLEEKTTCNYVLKVTSPLFCTGFFEDVDEFGFPPKLL